MPRYMTIGYGDRAGYDRTDPQLRAAAHARDASLVARGAIMGIAGAPVQVRNTDGKGLAVVDGPLMTAPLPVAGFAIIEADSLEDAIRLVSMTPCAVAHGVVEVWPMDDPRLPD